MAWKRSSVRSRPGPPKTIHNQALRRIPLEPSDGNLVPILPSSAPRSLLFQPKSRCGFAGLCREYARMHERLKGSAQNLVRFDLLVDKETGLVKDLLEASNSPPVRVSHGSTLNRQMIGVNSELFSKLFRYPSQVCVVSPFRCHSRRNRRVAETHRKPAPPGTASKCSRFSTRWSAARDSNFYCPRRQIGINKKHSTHRKRGLRNAALDIRLTLA